MRQLSLGKVENFPPQEELKCVMVEHSLQGEDGSLSVLDFIAAGKFFVKLKAALDLIHLINVYR